MDEEIVPYEEALELEKLGCNMHCWGSCYYEFYDRGNTYILLKTPDDMNEQDGVNAPTFSQAFRFFRKKYNLVIVIKPIDDKRLDLGYILTKNGLIIQACTTYEKAELFSVRKLIEIVKEKENGYNG